MLTYVVLSDGNKASTQAFVLKKKKRNSHAAVMSLKVISPDFSKINFGFYFIVILVKFYNKLFFSY